MQVVRVFAFAVIALQQNYHLFAAGSCPSRSMLCSTLSMNFLP